MNPRDIFEYKCSTCKQMHEPNYFGWNERTGARLKTCNMCRRKRSDREQAARERKTELEQELVASGVLWDAAAEMNMYTEVDTEMEDGPTAPTSYYNWEARTATGDTESYCGENESDYWGAGGYGPIREPIMIHLPGTSEEDRYIARNPTSASAAAVSYFQEEPEAEPAPDFGTESP
jgi:hypothetical protein